MPAWLSPSALGLAVRVKLADIGASARLFGRLVALTAATLRRPRLVVERRPPALLKGKAKPVAIYRVLELKD